MAGRVLTTVGEVRHGMTSGAGGLQPGEGCGRTRLLCCRQRLDDDLCEHLAVERLIAQPSIETLHIAILSRTAAIDVGGLRTDRPDPVLHRLRDELWSLVGADARALALSSNRSANVRSYRSR